MGTYTFDKTKTGLPVSEQTNKPVCFPAYIHFIMPVPDGNPQIAAAGSRLFDTNLDVNCCDF